VLVASDICLKGIPRELLPLGLPLLIQYDLPSSKDVLSRRIGAVFGSSKERGRRAGKQVVIDFVAAGEVAAFRARERLSSAPVMEMPVHVPDIFT
jgi:translation initiation factor 4A